MALPTGGGTETVHSILLEDVDNTPKPLITGVQHHVYTVLSINMHFTAATTGEDFEIYLTGYDSTAGASAQKISILTLRDQTVRTTFVWNDKFSFNGYEPSANTQIARAAQAGSAAQILNVASTNSGYKADVTCTYIDQDWS